MDGRVTILLTAVLAAACARDTERDVPGDSSATTGAGSQSRADSVAVCYFTGQSVLARTAPDTMATPLRGWMRLDRARDDSGLVLLVDSDSYSLEGRFQRVSDSVVVQAFNDFVRVEFRLAIVDTIARGTFRAHSDAALERDSAGVLREFRRAGEVRFTSRSCESLPFARR